jgi:hypothetical protein
MHSWQTENGESNGKPNAYYGNRFATIEPMPIKRGEWTCIEWSIKLNSAPDKADGAQRFWVDGKLVGEWAPGTPNGYWMRENFRIRPDQPERQKPFGGFRWRADNGVKINIFKLENYVNKGAWKNTENYAKEHPDYPLNTEQAIIWFDHVVVATEYIGPMKTERNDHPVTLNPRGIVDRMLQAPLGVDAPFCAGVEKRIELAKRVE